MVKHIPSRKGLTINVATMADFDDNNREFDDDFNPDEIDESSDDNFGEDEEEEDELDSPHKNKADDEEDEEDGFEGSYDDKSY